MLPCLLTGFLYNLSASIIYPFLCEMWKLHLFLITTNTLCYLFISICYSYMRRLIVLDSV